MAEFEVADVNVDQLRNVISGALEFEFVKDEAQHAACPLAGALALQLNWHLDANAVGGTDAEKVDVERFDAVGVPLEFADESGCLHRSGEVHHATSVTNRGHNSFPRGSQVDALFAVAIEDGGHQALSSEPAALPGTSALAEGNVECVAHGKKPSGVGVRSP